MSGTFHKYGSCWNLVLVLAFAGMILACSEGGDTTNGETAICSAGERFCSRKDVLTCGEDGRSWVFLETCADGFYCAEGVCVAGDDGSESQGDEDEEAANEENLGESDNDPDAGGDEDPIEIEEATDLTETDESEMWDSEVEEVLCASDLFMNANGNPQDALVRRPESLRGRRGLVQTGKPGCGRRPGGGPAFLP